MSRVVEGTSMGGFRCDAVGCGAKAVASPVICVPHENYPVEIRNPIIAFTDIHVCLYHQGAVTVEDQAHKPMRDQIEAIAAQSMSRPDFKRAYVKFIRVHSDDYQRFLETAGLVQPGDATIKTTMSDIIIPNLS